MTTTEFKRTVRAHYRKNGRKMPWRETRDPYRIVVSEIMLQQTQVDRVRIKYETFIKRFPTWKKLADAPVDAVLREWQGLGYNRRALFLKRMAEVVVQTHKGILPSDPLILKTLPGIGKATASAIAAYAFNVPTPFIETNIRSVYIHHFFPEKSGVRDEDLMPIISKTLDTKNPREWYWALMDYGTFIKKTTPNPSRKSAHHAKKTKLKGSLREARGAVIKLLGRKKMTEKQLTRESGIEDGRIELALGALMREGFIHEVRRTYILG